MCYHLFKFLIVLFLFFEAIVNDIVLFLIFFYLKHFLLFNYSCPHFPPITLYCPTHPPPPTFNPPACCLCPWVLYTCSPSFPRYLPTPWSLSVCSLFSCLWFYFACLLVCLLIRFHLKVRSYSICLSLPGLFHLA